MTTVVDKCSYGSFHSDRLLLPNLISGDVDSGKVAYDIDGTD